MVDALSESFDDETGFTKSSTFFVEGAGLQFLGLYDPLGAASDFDGALTPPSSTFTSGYSGFSGLFLIGADLDGTAPHPDTVTFTWSNIDVTGLRNVQFSGLFASLPDATEGPDAGDYILVEVSIDGGAFFSLLDFRADGANGEFRLDTNNDGVGDGAQLTGAAQSFSAAIIASGALSVELRLTVNMDGPHEDFAVDDFKVTGDLNTPPVAQNDSVSTSEGAVLNGDVLADNGNGADSDADADPLTVTAVNGQAVNVGSQITLASGALLTVNADGTFSYDPNGQFETLGAGATDTDSFTYTISDGFGGTDTATAAVTITGVNDAPTAFNDGVSTDENTIKSGNVLGNDIDVDIGDVLSVSAVNGVGASVGNQITLASGALLTVNANGTFSYDPNGQFETLGVGASDTDSFTYTVSDGNGGTDTATATVTITGVNDAPTAFNDGVSTDENTIKSGNVLGNDSDVDIGDVLVVSAVNGQGASVGNQITLASGALLTVNANGTFSYNPNDQFETLGVGASDTDSFIYTVSDGNGGTDTATATVTITGVNDAPIAQNDSFATDESLIRSGNVLNNNGAGVDSDIDIGDVLAISAVNGAGANVGNQITLASGALLIVNTNGTMFYNPNGAFETLGQGATDTDSFTYTTADGQGGLDNATVTFTITGLNDAPVAQNDSVSVGEDSPLNGSVFTNNGSGADSDIDIGDVLVVASVNGVFANVGAQITLGSGALLTVNANGSFNYDPNSQFETLGAGATATETFDYAISDGKGGTDNATATVTINGVNDAPIAQNDSFSTLERNGFGGNVFNNNGAGADTDIDIGDILNVIEINGQAANVGAQITLASGALLTVNADGTLSYDPNGAFDFLVGGDMGADSFTYTISDGNGGVKTATVSIDITGELGGLFTGTAGADIINSTIYADTVNGLAGDDQLFGLGGADEINGGGGDDLLRGAGGSDMLDGGTGVDTASYAGSAAGVNVNLNTGGGADGDAAGDTLIGVENLTGSDLSDLLTGDGAANVLLGGAGIDTLNGGGGDDILRGQANNDVLDGGDGRDTLTGNGGDDMLFGRGGNDRLFGGTGGDTIIGGANADRLEGQGGDDSMQGNGGNDIMLGGDGNDSLAGDTANDQLFGGLGADNLDGGDGVDTLNGDAGADTLFGRDGKDTLSGGADDDDLYGGANADRLEGQAGADLLVGGGGNDALFGGAGKDTLAGDTGADTLSGQGGNDLLQGGAGADVLDGGAGVDMVSYDDAAAGVFVRLSDGFADNSTASGDQLISIENLEGSAFGDSLIGSAGANLLAGMGGGDELTGGAGADTLDGGNGDDSLLGEADDDQLFGGSGDDTLDGGAGNDLVMGDGGADIVAGNIGDDTVFGGGGDDIVSGGDGDDSLFGGAGVDQLFGGLNNDTLFGGAGADIISGNDGDDFLFGESGNDNLFGGEGSDSINGGAGDDIVVGNFGADTLDGGAGDDTLLGGGGDDIFVFAPGAGNDQVSDFVSGAGSNEAILLTGFGAAFDSFADVQAAASNDGFGNVIIDLGGGDSILLLGKSVSDLTTDDFMFG